MVGESTGVVPLTVEALVERVRRYLPEVDPQPLVRAHRRAEEAHRGQVRRSGEAYVQHPLAVAMILADLEMDMDTLVAALLHDVVEDTEVTLADVEAEFGAEVAALVDGVTKLGRISFSTREEEQAENLRKMVVAMARDIRVILIKLADRLHNMRTLRFLPPDRQQANARETLEIFAPLAHRLGMYQLKWELEDLALRYLEPERYQELAAMVAKRRQEREAYVAQVADILRERLSQAGIRAEIQGRPKNFYSIYRKMYEQGKSFTEIYDLIAIRVLVDSVRDCYGALGIVHTLWKPIPGRFKDYVAMPKSNLYQSLHTTVVGPGGEPFEIQIRTWEMHRTAEYGIAAHWRYKEGKDESRPDDFDQRLSWLRQVMEWQHETRDAREFMESLKIDLFSDEVFVFTPKGAVLELPRGSTPVDFAYRIHTDIGHHCVGARVNGHIVPLDYQLKNGDIVEILTSKTAPGPSADWLTFVKTSGAKNRIRNWFKAKNRDANIVAGRESLEREARRQGLPVSEVLRVEALEEVARRYNLATADDLLAAVGYGGLTAGQVMTRLKDRWQQSLRPAEPAPLPSVPPRRGGGKAEAGVQVDGMDRVLVRYSQCCHPVPGDPIFGYVTRGRGVSVHRFDCPNAPGLLADTERVIDVRWVNGEQTHGYPVEIEVQARDRVGLLADVAGAVAQSGINILSAHTRGYRDGSATVSVRLEIRHLGELNGIMEKIRRLRDVVSVHRVAREHAHARKEGAG